MTNTNDLTADDVGYDSVDALMRYEAGELDEPETIRLFQHLVNNGLAWKLQGSYGRRARDLLKVGLIQLPSNATEMADSVIAPGNRPVNRSRFPLGQTVVTAHALDTLRPDEIALGLARHVRGDWGDLCPEDMQANENALTQGGRLFSAYGQGASRFWIITEWDRSVTTILLPRTTDFLSFKA
jgi:hypothetical protein